jgi:single-strand DNA-binding protein
MATLVTVIGNLVKDPEFKDLGSGKVLAKLRVASTDRFQDSDGSWKDGDTAFYDVVCWRTLAENVSANLTKGNKVIVHGKLKYREFDRKDGTKGNAFEIDATDIGQSMSFKKSAFTNKTSTNVVNNVVTISEDEPDPWA